MKNRLRAFSLVELLVVVAILAILTALYSGSNTGKRRHATLLACQDNLRKLFIALEIYSHDNSGWFPRAARTASGEEPLDLLVPKYTADTSIFICPGSADTAIPAGESLRKRTISYAYYSGRRSGTASQVLITDRQVDTRSKAVGEIAFSTTGKPPGNNHAADGGNLLFTDGEVRASPARLTMALDFPPDVTCLNPRR